MSKSWNNPKILKLQYKNIGLLLLVLEPQVLCAPFSRLDCSLSSFTVTPVPQLLLPMVCGLSVWN